MLPPGDAANETRAPARARLLAWSLALAALAVFSRVASHGFVAYDDDLYVTGNPRVQGGLTAANLLWALTATRGSNWHPLTWWSHMLDCQLFGLFPAGHHLVSVGLHALNGVVLFLFLRRATGAEWRSALVAALFALHPAHVESVAWVAERKDVLCGLFWFASLWAYTAYAESPTAARYTAVAALFALALAAKPMAVTLPFVLLLLDYWPLARLSGARGALRCVAEKLPLLALSAASCAVTLKVQRGATAGLDLVPLALRLENASASIFRYLRMLLWPSDLAVFYPLRPDVPAAAVAAGVALLLGLSVAAILFRRRRPYLLVGWFWFLGTLVPVLGLVAAGAQAMADRYTYLPYVGLFLAISWGAGDLVSARPRWKSATVGVAALALLGLGLAAVRQAGYWADSVTLLGRSLTVAGDSPSIRNNLGLALVEEGRVVEAVGQYRRALELDAEFWRARHNLGLALDRLGRGDEAARAYSQVLLLRPDHAEAHLNLGVALAEKGRYGEAAWHFREVLRLDPSDRRAAHNLALCGEREAELRPGAARPGRAPE